jgi:hypothetical protein
MPTLTLSALAALIAQPADSLRDGLEPADGLRVWGATGIATVHAGGKIQLVVRNRRIHTVVCNDDPDNGDHKQYPHLGGSVERRAG